MSTHHCLDYTPVATQKQIHSKKWVLGFVTLALITAASGCTALNPIRGVPASYVPDQFMGPSRDNKRTIDLSLLVRSQPDQYRVEAGDVLSIYVPRVLGTASVEISTVGISPPINMPSSLEDPPTVGYPIQVRDNHTIALPQIPPLYVYGMTLHEVEKAIFQAYTVDHDILTPSEALVMVSLQRPRVTRVMVVRQEATTSLSAGSGAGSVNIGTTGKGTARTVVLKAYENDVLHALTRAEGVDGLPGLNAENTIYVIRRRQRPQTPTFKQPRLPGYQQQGAMPVRIFSQNTTGASVDDQYDSGISNGSGIQLVSHEMPQSFSQPKVRNFQPSNSYGSSVSRGNPLDVVNAYSNSHRVEPAAEMQPQYHAVPLQTLGNDSIQVQQSVYGVPGQVMQSEGIEQQIMNPIMQQIQYSEQSYQPQNSHMSQDYPAPQMQYGNPQDSYPSQNYNQQNAQPYSMPQQNWNQSNQIDTRSLSSGWNALLDDFDPTIDNPNVIKIPIRLAPGEMPNIDEESITLYDGDIVFIESRETEVFYTAGLLGGGQFTLPRDYDLCVVEAVSIAESRQVGGGQVIRSMGGVSALSHDISSNASRLAIIRTLPTGKRINIEVDLKKAMRMTEENIRIQPGDVLVLQYTFPEAVGAFTQRYLLEGAVFGVAAGLVTGSK